MDEWITKEVEGVLAGLSEDRQIAAGQYARLALSSTEQLLNHIDAAARSKPWAYANRVLSGLVVVDQHLVEMVGDAPSADFSPTLQTEGYRRFALTAEQDKTVRALVKIIGPADETVFAAHEELIGMHGNVCGLSAECLNKQPYNAALDVALYFLERVYSFR